MNTAAIETNRKIIRVMTVVGIIVSVLLFIWIKSQSSLFAMNGEFQQFITQIGLFGPLMFVIVQIIQVVYPVIPGGLMCVIGHAVFGPLFGFVLNFTGITIGSIANFFLARTYGKSFAQAFVDEETYDKYITYLDDEKLFTKILFGAFALPGFPDDFLCMVAGLSKMTFKKFMIIYLISKPITLYLYTVIAMYGIEVVMRLF